MCVKYPAGGTEASECALVTRKDQNLALSKARGCPAWVYANAGQAGYYRVLYELQVFASLAENEKGLTLPERVGFVGDISALTQGSLPLGEAMALVPKFTKDPEPDVISKTVDIVGDLDEHIIPDQFKPNYRRYLSDLYKQRSEDLGWKDRPDDSPPVRLLRPVLFELMANHAVCDLRLIERGLHVEYRLVRRLQESVQPPQNRHGQHHCPIFTSQIQGTKNIISAAS